VLQVQDRVPFEYHWRVTKGASNRGVKQSPVVCENTAGRRSPSDAFADWGQARLQVAPYPLCLPLLLASCSDRASELVIPPPRVPADLQRPCAGYTGPLPQSEGQISDPSSPRLGGSGASTPVPTQPTVQSGCADITNQKMSPDSRESGHPIFWNQQ
jgi:hypothetical protein